MAFHVSRDIVESDLETAEAKLEEAHATIDQEKKTRCSHGIGPY